MPRSFALKTYADDSVQVLLRQVRAFMRDQAPLNALIDGEESGDDVLELMVDMAVDDWNQTPPRLSLVTADTHPARSMLILYVVALTLWSASILQARNQLAYGDGGISVQTSDKAVLYQQMAGQIMQQYEAKKMRLKKSQNAELAYGGLLSEYSLTTFAQYQWASYDSYASLRDGFKV